MKRWTVCWPDYDENGNSIDVQRTYSEEEILDFYWDWWSEQMIRKYGPGHPDITHEKCIDDWIVVNWAWEADSEGT